MKYVLPYRIHLMASATSSRREKCALFAPYNCIVPPESQG